MAELPEGALAGVRVIDLTRILAGPFCTMQLGDMGADVIKVETPSGDHVRGQGAIVEGLSWYFAAFNRNKRSVVLDLRSEFGRQALTRLIAGADMLVENYRPGVLDEMGFTTERLEEINPRLITVSINGYGSTGPYADRPSFDFIAQAMSGFMSVNGREEDPPLRAAPPVTDLLAGLWAAFAAVSALEARRRTGKGQRVEAAMMGSAMSIMAYLSANFLATGELPARTGNDHPVASPYGLFRASDGEVAVAPSTKPTLTRFMTEIGLLHLLDEPRFADNAARVKNRKALNALIDEAMCSRPRAEWVDRLNRAGVPCGVVQDLAQAFSDPQALHQEWVTEVEHPGHGTVRMTGFPAKLSATPAAARRPAPDLGQHTAEVLREVGLEPPEG